MPFTAGELAIAQKESLDYFLRNNPIDQITVMRPLYKMLMKGKKSFPGAKQFVVVQLFYQFQSNFMWFNGNMEVSYNSRAPIEQANFPWREAHDGLALVESKLIQNGISVSESGPGGTASKAEWHQLDNYLTQQNRALKGGFVENMSQSMHLDGTQSVDALAGLDALITFTPTSGLVGGIDRATNVWWRNHAATGLTVTTDTGTILDKMETAWKACIRAGGEMPNFMVCGTLFHDGFRQFMMNSYGQLNFRGVEERELEGGTKGLMFHGVEIMWSPEFAQLDTLYAPSVPWEKRCYFLNTEHITLMPVEGQDMVTRKPPRPYNRYEHYIAMTWRGAMTVDKPNTMAALSVA